MPDADHVGGNGGWHQLRTRCLRDTLSVLKFSLETPNPRNPTHLTCPIRPSKMAEKRRRVGSIQHAIHENVQDISLQLLPFASVHPRKMKNANPNRIMHPPAPERAEELECHGRPRRRLRRTRNRNRRAGTEYRACHNKRAAAHGATSESSSYRLRKRLSRVRNY